MFLDILELVFDSFEGVINALKVDLFTVGTVGINFWELVLGFLTIAVIFGFFLAPRAGSGIQVISNENKKANAEYLRSQHSSAKRNTKGGK